MLAFIDKANAPLGGTTEAMVERATTDFIQNLSNNLGVEITGDD